ncbi:glycosyltransferase family 4 protein [Aurantiacibacter poecillastricola]|uniref:glycosyltransferase family 4 protein n=1 Tax=Aurantiacibacter poecillastricola TaxID=3064385 RepID=UPI00273E4032|nr:glycosyltransferase family 1 protein [Aurantiacibacter sp. 219JJ12-13]MDP5261356.1 glycosyltransferase family 1 protein [Aurantiacibacter sp. 219JJ12-13]
MGTVLIDGYNLGLEKGTGVATYARNLSYELNALGHEVSVLYGKRSPFNKDELLQEINFFDQPVELNRFLYLMERAKQALRGPLSYRADKVPITGRVVSTTFQSKLPYYDTIYNSNDLYSSAQSAYWMWGKLIGVKMQDRVDLAHWTYPLPVYIENSPNIYTMHDLVPLKLPYTTLDNKRRYLRLMRLLGERADHIVTVSENSKRDIVELLGIPEEKITNTYQSVQIPAKYRDKPEEEVAREVRGITGFDFKEYFLFWGSLEPKKNIARILEAYMASDVDTPLVIIGAQAWKAENELALLNENFATLHEKKDANAKERKVSIGNSIERQRGARKRIVRLDYAPFSMLVSLIRGAKAALFPSLYEGFGLPALEAMLLGTPVLCSNTSSLPEVVGDAARMVDPYDTREITTAIRELDQDADLRRDLSERGKAQAALYSPENYRERLAGVYSRYL